jgi:hypothetical protein
MSNIKTGFYKVAFHAALPGAGGIVVVENGNIRGGDNQYLYSGTISENGTHVSAKIVVTAMSSATTSVFGSTGGKFELDLTGIVEEKRFQLTGPSPFPGTQGIEITGTWITNL